MVGRQQACLIYAGVADAYRWLQTLNSYEHAMLGVNGALAANLHRRCGWQIVALSGAAAMLPDWDGLPILFSHRLFAQSHRVWGHNVLACILAGGLLGALDYRYDLATRIGRWFSGLARWNLPAKQLTPRCGFSTSGLAAWMLVGALAALTQLPADMVVSGTAQLNDWHIKLLWPFSDRGWVYPLVGWDDAGGTVILLIGMFALVRYPSHLRPIAISTLGVLLSYLIAREILSG